MCGSIQDIKTFARIAKKNNIKILIDTAQTAGIVDFDNNEIDADFVAFSGHKGLMMPMGTGGIYVKEGIILNPVITGGTGSFSESAEQPKVMPDMLQSGTLNAPAIIAGKKSIDFILREGVENIHKKEFYLSSMLINDLKNMKNVKVHSPEIQRNGTVAFNLTNIDSVTVSDILNRDFGICTRGGWHCAYPAHVALGTKDTGCVRASFGYFNTKKDAKKLVDAIYKIIYKKNV